MLGLFVDASISIYEFTKAGTRVHRRLQSEVIIAIITSVFAVIAQCRPARPWQDTSPPHATLAQG